MHSLLSVLLAAAIPVPAPATPTGGLDWKTCGSQKDAQCATLTVPVDWSDPQGPTLGLAVARRTAPDPARRVGTLVFGPGGPSDSGVWRVTEGAERFSDKIRERFDIVSFDPRGVGDSSPMRCDPELVDAAPNPVLGSQRDFDTMLAYNRTLWADCALRTGPVWEHADTLSTVRDVDALRAALGERQLSFHGSSYGTLLGQQYAERYPYRVRAMVLESVTDHSSRTTAEFLAAQAWALEDSFDAFVAWCDRDRSCALHGRDVRAVWNGLFEDPDRVGMTPFDLVALTHKGVKDPDYPRLATILKALDSGQPGQSVGNLGVVIPAFCADWSLPIRDYADYAAVMRRANAAAPDTRFPAQAFALTMCLGWPHVANPQRPARVHTRVPLLLLNARHDPATGWNWARSVERQLGGNGVLVTYRGAGHGSYTVSDCMERTADRYLVALAVPARGSACD
ncbi:MAG: alpha/beta hydrolase [Actinoplanes sp.]